jgi:hypothetical protein
MKNNWYEWKIFQRQSESNYNSFSEKPYKNLETETQQSLSEDNNKKDVA